MPKSRSRRDVILRRHLAYMAARIMAEDGVTDYAMAKWKAARQAGLADANLLPDNPEIEAALREYQGLYQSEAQPAQLRRLREIAVEVMREFAEFRPALVGPVLSGTAGAHSPVDLEFFSDDPKALTIRLLNRRRRFEETTRRLRRGDRLQEYPGIRLDVDGVDVNIVVLGLDDERTAPRPRRDAQVPLRARLGEVEALLAARGAGAGP